MYTLAQVYDRDTVNTVSHTHFHSLCLWISTTVAVTLGQKAIVGACLVTIELFLSWNV